MRVRALRSTSGPATGDLSQRSRQAARPYIHLAQANRSALAGNSSGALPVTPRPPGDSPRGYISRRRRVAVTALTAMPRTDVHGACQRHPDCC